MTNSEMVRQIIERLNASQTVLLDNVDADPQFALLDTLANVQQIAVDIASHLGFEVKTDRTIACEGCGTLHLENGDCNY